MAKQITRIVLTGGPAAGKTTLISRILKEFKQDEGWKVITIPETATELISGFGIKPFGERMQNFPAQLSGGEQQRVAIARALAKRPRLLLCDEPTGALDYQTGKQILALLQKQSRENGMTVVIITHNSALTAMADRVIRVRSGQITDVRQNAAPVPVESIEW